MMFPHLPKQPEVYSTEIYKEKQFGVYNPLPALSTLHLQGYFQSEKYFKDYRKEVIEAFRLPKIDGSSYHNYIAIHVRRGDYLKLSHKHNLITKEWIEKAMLLFPEEEFIFFSDDISWCYQTFILNDRCRFRVSSYNKMVDMVAISKCKGCIMSPSSFSWWANWIADDYATRKVVVPRNWFAEGYTKLRTDDIVPEHWVKL